MGSENNQEAIKYAKKTQYQSILVQEDTSRCTTKHKNPDRFRIGLSRDNGIPTGIPLEYVS